MVAININQKLIISESSCYELFLCFHVQHLLEDRVHLTAVLIQEDMETPTLLVYKGHNLLVMRGHVRSRIS